MRPTRDNPFQRRLEKRGETQGSTRAATSAPPPRRLLDTIGLTANISLAVVAIFGYFYTVRPVYQKERLSEQVAEYETIIKKQTPKIAEIEARLASLQQERTQLSTELQREKSRLTAELTKIERQLVAARDEKTRIENSIQFMAYKYQLPNGKPATTRDEVRQAQEYQLKRSFATNLMYACELLPTHKDFSDFGSHKIEADKEKQYPFTESEMALWREQEAKIPFHRAMTCAEAFASTFTKTHERTFSPALLAGFREEAIQQIKGAGAKAWVPPLVPDDIIKEYRERLTVIERDKKVAQEEVEKEYGAWESVKNVDRRAIFKNNYHVGKFNAESKHRSEQMSAEWAAKGKADKLRKSVNEEVKRLIQSATKADR
jgi:hypothetical protein